VTEIEYYDKGKTEINYGQKR